MVVMLSALLWGSALVATAGRVLAWLSRNRERYHTVVTPRTLPVFDFVARTVVFLGTACVVFLAWDIDVTGWLASAGIVGIAVGFASQETLGNMVAGVSILADAPYRLGDWLVLETGERGQVVDIGIRTTRLQTREDVAIVVPNRMMANARVLNQSGGPQEAFRVAIPIQFAYGCDIDLVHREVLAVVRGVQGVQPVPEPRIRFRGFGSSGLEHDVLVWVDPPADRGVVVHRVCTAVYKRCVEAGIEIPYTTVKIEMHAVGGEETE
jgi:small-conductance mechanosensitive channel